MKNAIVIGGNSGIGAATAEILRGSERACVWTPTIEEMDVRTGSSVGKYITEVVEASDGASLDVVYSAGVNDLEWIGELSEHALRQIWEVNVNGFLRVLDGLMSTAVRGIRIVAVSSDAAERPMRTSIAYCASKAALNMAVRVAARETAEYGWRVNAVAPGMTAPTGMSHYIDNAVQDVRGWSALQMLEYEMQQAVIKRRASPGEIAHVICDILDGPDYLNGSIITINGGR